MSHLAPPPIDPHCNACDGTGHTGVISQEGHELMCGCVAYAIADPEPAELTEAEALELIDRYNGHQERAARIRANAEALIAEEERKASSILERYASLLKPWAAARLKPGKRSFKTLFGVIGFRTVPARLVIRDEAAAIEWARQHQPDAVEVRTCLNAAAIGGPDRFRAVGEHGTLGYEVPHGFDFSEERETFYIKPVPQKRTSAASATEGGAP